MLILSRPSSLFLRFWFSHFFGLRCGIHIAFSLEIAIFYSRIVKVLPFGLLLFVSLLNLRIFESKFQRFNLCLFRFFDILWIIWLNFEFIRDDKFL
jgi:hypothetical protein